MRSVRTPLRGRVVVVRRGIPGGVIVAVLLLAGGAYWWWSRAQGADPVRTPFPRTAGRGAEDAWPTTPTRSVEFDRFHNHTTIAWSIPMRPLKAGPPPVAWVVWWVGTGNLSHVSAGGLGPEAHVQGYGEVPSKRQDWWAVDGQSWSELRPTGLRDFPMDEVERFSRASKVELKYEGLEYEMHPDGPQFLAQAARELSARRTPR